MGNDWDEFFKFLMGALVVAALLFSAWAYRTLGIPFQSAFQVAVAGTAVLLFGGFLGIVWSRDGYGLTFKKFLIVFGGIVTCMWLFVGLPLLGAMVDVAMEAKPGYYGLSAETPWYDNFLVKMAGFLPGIGLIVTGFWQE